VNKIKVFVEAMPLAKEHSSGIGHLLSATLTALVAKKEFTDKYELLFFTPRNKKEVLQKNIIIGGKVVALPYPAARVVNALNYMHLLPKIDKLLGNGVYLFANYANYPLSHKSKSITWVHDLSYERFPQTVSPKLQKHLHKHVPEWIRRSDKVVGISEFSCSEIVSFYKVIPSKVVYIPAGVDPTVFNRQPQSQIDKALVKYKLPQKYILFIGNIEPRKNLQFLIKVFSGLKKEIKDTYSLVIVGGDGWNNQAIYDQIATARNTGSSIIIPEDYVQDADMPALISGANLLVQFALYEGFGMTPLEALACGTPVLASDIPPHKEVLGEYGGYIDPNDEPKAILALTNAIQQKIHSNLVPKVTINHYDWSNAATRLLATLDELSDTIKGQN
jgi:glycosyltransferase involved in cell wall biosynthesis